MLLKFLLLTILATTIMAADYLKQRHYGAMLFPRQESLYACSDLSLESCGATTDCCTAGVTCDGVGCCPIGETCTGVPTVHTLVTDVSATPTDSNSPTFLTTPTATTEDTRTPTDNTNTITAAATTPTTEASTTPTTEAGSTASAATGAGVPVAVSGSPYFLAALGCFIAGLF